MTFYGQKQALRGWYEKLASFLLEKGFDWWSIQHNSIYQRENGCILIVQIYVDRHGPWIY